MQHPPLTFRQCITGVLAGLGISFFVFLSTATRDNRVVFCSVGQGSATYVRFFGQSILIDTGPNSRVLSCLGKYHPTNRTINLLIITHFESDHTGGVSSLVSRYTIQSVICPSASRTPEESEKMLSTLQKKGAKIQYGLQNNQYIFSNVRIKIYSPSKASIKQLTIASKSHISTIISESNELCLIVEIDTPHWNLLIPGDAPSGVLSSVTSRIPHSSVLVIPHHGSKNSLSKKFLAKVHPDVAIISVGKNNPFGHPHQNVLTELKKQHIPLRRTDIEGDIIIGIPN